MGQHQLMLQGGPEYDFESLLAVMRRELAPMSSTPYVPATPHGLGNFYVRPDTSHSGTRDGTSYATAWGGYSEIVWGSLGADTTLWVCGTWSDINFTIDAEGTSGHPFDIRLDHPSDPARIWNSTPIPSGDWTASGVNGEYWVGTVGGSPVDNGELMLYVDGERSFGCSKSSGNTRNIRFVVTPVSASINLGNSSITFFSTERTYVTGDKVIIPFAGNDLSLPAPLVKGVQYYVIALAADTIQFAASYADAIAGTEIILTDDGDGDIWKVFHETPDQTPYLDPQPGTLQPGQHWWDGVNSRLYWKPPAGVPADYETSLSVDRNSIVGAALYMTSRDYVRIWGGGEYGGIFGVGPAGKVGRCHTNAIQCDSCNYILIDGVGVYGCRSGIAFKGGIGNVSRNCRVADSGWHGVGGEGGSVLETDLIHERHWITDVGHKFDWGDMQGIVFNAGNNDSHIRRNLLQRVGRNAANCNQGVLVCDTSSRSHIHRNIIDDCYGEAIEVGCGSAFPTPPQTNVDSSATSNIIYRLNRDLGGYGSNQSFTVSPYQVRAQKADSLISRFKFMGNLVGFSRTPSDAGGEIRGLLLLRANNFLTAVVSDIEFKRNAATELPPSAAMWSVASYASGGAPNPTFVSDYNLWTMAWPFLRREHTGDPVLVYEADHVVGSSAGYWVYDSGQDANSVLIASTPADIDTAPDLGAAALEFLRQDDGFDSLDAPTEAGIGRFPF